MSTHVRKRLVALMLAVGLAAAASAEAGAQSSDGYVLLATTVASAGDFSDSDGYASAGSAGQASPVAASSSDNFLLQSGFWSFVGTGAVRIVLRVDRNVWNPDHVDLEWSGNTPPYEIYAASDCAQILSYLYASSSDNSAVGVPQDGEYLTCFNVISRSTPEAREPNDDKGGSSP